MGKRELLLIGGFILMGVVVYSLTAPDAPAAGNGFSIANVINEARREIRGNHATAEVDSTTATAIGPSVRELRIEARTVSLSIIGEDRADVASELKVWSNGYEEQEARKYAQETKLKATLAGDTLIIEIDYPRPAEQRSTLVVRVPKRLTVRVQPNRGKLQIRGVANVDLVEVRGDVNVAEVAGRVTAVHRGGPLTIESAETIKLNMRGGVATLKNISGSVSVLAQAGEVRGVGLRGPLDVDGNNTKIMLEDLQASDANVRLNTVGGSVSLAGVRSELRLDARDTEVTVAIAQPASISIYTEGEESTNVSLPPGGFTLDALAVQSQLTLPPGLPEIAVTATEQRATGPVGGGGPTITLRSSRGPIVVKEKEKENEQEKEKDEKGENAPKPPRT
jgi:hypothetical protein